MSHWAEKFDEMLPVIRAGVANGETTPEIAAKLGVNPETLKTRMRRRGHDDLVRQMMKNNPLWRAPRTEDEDANILAAVRHGIENHISASRVAKSVGLTQTGLSKHLERRGYQALYEELVSSGKHALTLDEDEVVRRLILLRLHDYQPSVSARAAGLSANTMHMFLRRAILGSPAKGVVTMADYMQLCEDYLDA